MKSFQHILMLAVVLLAAPAIQPWAQGAAPCLATPSTPTPGVRLSLLGGGFEQPVFLTHAGDGSERLFVVEQPGIIRIIEGGVILEGPFLDIRNRVAFRGERGLLSMAFHPNYASNGRFFVNYTSNRNGQTVIAEYRAGSDTNVADAFERIVLEIDQPFSNHNGGQIQFGPDGFLYIGMGDGGAGGDPLNSGQSLSTLLGALLRIDVDGGEPYAIPVDNPFIGQANARPEIYAYGLRNPWRFSFDRCDGRLFLADVGQDRIEEVDLIVKGGNYGWNTMEGNECFPRGSVCVQGGFELPIATYAHNNTDGGFSVTGGYVYRGRRFPELMGRYFFADFVSTRLWSLTQTAPARWEMQPLLVAGFNISSFGEDEAGELYVTGFDGGIYRLEAIEADSATAVALALDVNGSLMLEDAEILAAIQLWTTQAPVPGAQFVIDDTTIRALMKHWATGARLQL